MDEPTPMIIEATLPGRRRRTVTFAQEVSRVVSLIPSLDDISRDEKHGTWWCARDYDEIRDKAKFLTKDFRRREQDLIKRIDEAYNRSMRLAVTLKTDEDYNEFMQNPAEQANILTRWCHKNQSGRGLERYLSSKHRHERSAFAVETRAAAIRLSKKPSADPVQVAVYYREYSRAATIFARLCGAADASAAVEAHKPKPPTQPKRKSRSDLLVQSSPGRALVSKHLSSSLRGENTV